MLFTVLIICYMQRKCAKRRREKVYIGCGAGFGGDRPLAALKLLQKVKQLNYLVLECLAERTLADRYQIMVSGGDGYDSQSKFLILKTIFFMVHHGVSIFISVNAV